MLHLSPFSPSNFSRYVSQTEQNTEESIDTSEWVHASLSAMNDIPPLMSISTTPTGNVGATNPFSRLAMFSPPMPEEIEPLPFPLHGPGPIQRPNKLSSQPTQSSHMTSSIQSPQTPDVLDQINDLLYQQSASGAVGAGTPNVSHVPVTSPLINDLGTPNISWGVFSSMEWSPKTDSSWPLPNLQTAGMPSTSQMQNPFALVSVMQGQQRQSSRGESPVWSTATPRYLPSSNRTQRASTWNELFSSTVPSATESAKPTNTSWLKDWSAPDPAANDGTTLNGHEPAPNNPFWNMPMLPNDAVVPSVTQVQRQTSSSGWWSTTSSDENNNKNQFNQSNGDTATTRDHSRWDFAR